MAKAAFFAAVFFAAESFFSFLVMPEILAARFMVEDMYQAEGIDVLIIGSSATMTAVDPFVLGDGLSRRCFNASSSLQQPVASYHLLKDILRVHAPKTVIFSANYSAFNVETADALQSNLILYDYMKPSLAKLQFFLSAFKPGDYPDALLKSYHYRANFEIDMLAPDAIREKLNKPRETKIHSTAEYVGGGFTSYTSVWNHEEEQKYTPPPVVDAGKERYLRKLIELCADNGIEVILLTTPFAKANVQARPDYFELENGFFGGIAREYGAAYIDLNLAKPETLPIENRHFRDQSHVNAQGAALVSQALADIMDGHVSGEFYGSVGELLAAWE